MLKQLAVLRADPVEAVRDVRATLEVLPPGYSAERQFMVQFASRLGGDPSDVLAMLQAEVQRTFPSGANGRPPDGFFDASVALDTMIDRQASPSVIESTVVAALEGTADPMARTLLIARYERLSPDGAARLRHVYLP